MLVVFLINLSAYYLYMCMYTRFYNPISHYASSAIVDHDGEMIVVVILYNNSRLCTSFGFIRHDLSIPCKSYYLTDHIPKQPQ